MSTHSVLDRPVNSAPAGSRDKAELLVIETHPIQYHVPVYRHLQQAFGISVTVVFGSDFSIAGYRDQEFQSDFAWDTDLLSGYNAVFLERTSSGGARNVLEVNTRGLAEVLSRLKPRTIMCVGYSPRFHWESLRCAFSFGRPVLFRGETTDHANQRSPIKNWLRDIALRRLYGSCSSLMFVGKRSKEHFRRLGVEDNRLFLSPYCIDSSCFRCDETARIQLRGITRDRLGISQEDFVIAFSGKLSSRKGPDILVNAVRCLPERIRNRCVIVMIGNGDMAEHLRAMAASEPATRLLHVGFQPQQELSPFYHAADLLVLPSRHSETWGLVVNEALHHGIPAVVSTAVGCGPDLIEPGKTGEVFATGSVEGLAASLSRCLTFCRTDETRFLCRSKVADYSTAKAAEGIKLAYDASLLKETHMSH